MIGIDRMHRPVSPDTYEDFDDQSPGRADLERLSLVGVMGSGFEGVEGHPAMLIRLSEGADSARFCRYLGEVGATVEDLGHGFVVGGVVDPVTEFHEVRELIGYVLTWNALNPRDPVEVVEPIDRGKGLRDMYPPGLVRDSVAD